MKRAKLNRFFIKLLLSVIILLSCKGVSFAQPALPERALTVAATQGLYFGKFYDLGTGGSVSVDWQGIRTTTGSIVPAPNSVARPAIFEVRLCQGRNVAITYAPTTILSGSNGGVFTLNIGPTEKGINGASFTVENNCNFITVLRVGGTLIIPGNAPPGFYSGNFEISFDQQ
ncbi:hypothetical protein PI23P_08460 [Polaribacter irgensii 23-P]|uniref:DUF4402 domain-containing protein n=1 Tax=Polaribacter irgensii 23-P TaxID=313594 RepID=A4BZQ1_9FLAO|nr:DUF4402 domain-containing protein [Polaribacter irgensii]EAR12644.1 hypothetical protein PI23P_08460 [Polaribacter irgensii 23-P]